MSTQPTDDPAEPTVDGTIESAVRTILAGIGEDPDRDGLVATPARVRRMYEELTAGYAMDPDEVLNDAVFEVGYSEMVVVKDISFHSLCEHHLLPFAGMAAVAYIPDGRVIGLSKIPRVVDMYARRLQVQERLTQQIADFLMERLAPQGVGRRRRGHAPLRQHARHPQARHGHDHLGRAGTLPPQRQDASRVLQPPAAALHGRPVSRALAYHRGHDQTAQGAHRQARARRPRSRCQGARARPAGRRLRGRLHGAAADAGDGRQRGAPGGRRRGRAVHPLGCAHDARCRASASSCARRAWTTSS